jgi:uncharacterized protein YjbI with pentapeptide repeats
MAQSPKRCPVSMRADSRPCGRPLHLAPSGQDSVPVCLMHTLDISRDGAAFNAEIEAILAGTSKEHRPENAFDFTGFVFRGEVALPEKRFSKRVVFFGATFFNKVNFDGSAFMAGVSFRTARFRAQLVSFGARFMEEADFFAFYAGSDAIFSQARFFCIPDFGSAQFVGDARFWGTEFYHGVNFSGAGFGSVGDFSRSMVGMPVSPDMYMPTNFQPKRDALADFTSATFQHPDEVLFYQVNQSGSQGLRVRLVNSNVTKLRFEDVNWHRRHGRVVLQDEIDILTLNSDSGSTHELVANTYRGLIINFETNRHYDLAEDCFCGAMEMKRLAPGQFVFPRLGQRLYVRHAWARWVGSHLSFVYLYRLLSNYGSSYSRALIWLAIFVLFFGVLFPFLGLQMSETRQKAHGGVLTADESSTSEVFYWKGNRRAMDFGKTLSAGIWTSIDSATFHKSSTVEPAGKWGRRLALAEMVIVPSQLALFLLALRRRFRR